MKLLIVDDQPGVTEGLCHGVNWAQLGFSQVQAVNSVREARAAMLNTVPDVMLCDIEMPEETGLELFKWVKKQGFATRCIFLTAHAKFSYAQEAMHLGAFDYIIQPAPYSEISQVTARAVKDVQASRDQKELTQMGRAFRCGYLDTTSPQLSSLPSTAPSFRLGHWLRAFPPPMV